MVQVPTKRTLLPSSRERLTLVTERTSSTSACSTVARSMERPGTRRISPKPAKKASSSGIFSSATINMAGLLWGIGSVGGVDGDGPAGIAQPGRHRLCDTALPLWRGNLLPLGCAAVVKPLLAVGMIKSGRMIRGCFAALREQAPSPRKISKNLTIDYKSLTRDFS